MTYFQSRQCLHYKCLQKHLCTARNSSYLPEYVLLNLERISLEWNSLWKCHFAIHLFVTLLARVYQNSCSFELDVWEQAKKEKKLNKQNSKCWRWTNMLSLPFLPSHNQRDYQGTFLTAWLQGTTFQLTLFRKVVLATGQEQDTQHLIHKPRQSQHCHIHW